MTKKKKSFWTLSLAFNMHQLIIRSCLWIKNKNGQFFVIYKLLY